MSSRFTAAVDPCRHSIPRSHTADTALLNAIQQSHAAGWTGLGLGLGLLWLDNSAAQTTAVTVITTTGKDAIDATPPSATAARIAIMSVAMPTITRLHPNCTERALSELVELLQSCVNGGASVGFFAPLSDETARLYWQEALAELASERRWIWVARQSGRIVGSVQLAICHKPNGFHRAEVQKLLVHSAFRRQGIAAGLLHELETTALAGGRELLVLDTSTGDSAESLYRRLGYCEAGLIPGYTRTPHGEPHSTSIYYKHLSTNAVAQQLQA